MRSWKKMSVGLKVAITATVVLALSVVGVLAAERFGGSSQDDAVKARETGAGSQPNRGDDVTFAGKPMELGTAAKISSNYRVAVTEISRYEIPTGLLLAATIDATYIGKEDGEPWADLSVEYVGPRKKAYGESGCPFDLGEADPAEQPTLKTGDETTYAVCVELPDTEVTRGRLTVQEAFSTRDRISWSVKEAVTKALPSATPAAPSQSQAPVTRPQPAQQSDDDDTNDPCEDWDDEKYEDYKDWGNQIKEQYEEYRNAGGNDEDRIEDYEDWEEDYDEHMDFLDKAAEAC